MIAARPIDTPDRVFTWTRVLAVIIVPILLAAFLMLYLVPHRSGELFAWPIRPSITAMMLGAAYAGGAWFFTVVAMTRRWHTIGLGLLPVSAFAGYLGAATALHWGAFTPGHVSFILWAFLYFTLPPIIAATWFANRRTDPGGAGDGGYPPIPTVARMLLAAVGSVLVVASLLFFLVPDVMIPAWPWRLSPLTSRVMAALFVLPGLVGLGIARDGRWSAARSILQAQIGSIALILIALLVARGDVTWTHPGATVFLLGMGGFVAGLVGLYLTMERRAGTA